MRTIINLSGKRFGRLVVVKRTGTHTTPNGTVRPMWLCVCDCKAVVTVSGFSLRNCTTRSCGCLAIDTVTARSTKHGQSRRGAVTRERAIWNGMKQRCHNANHRNYDYYGGRGIAVCDKWREDFAAFYADMGPCPPGHTIDRIDNNGPYAPDNCRWATRATQRRNQRGRMTIVDIAGERMCLTDAANRFGVNREMLKYRIDQGWPHDLAVTAPRQKPGPKPAR